MKGWGQRASCEGGADRERGKTCSIGPQVGIQPGPLRVRHSLDGGAALPGELHATPDVTDLPGGRLHWSVPV